MKQTSNNCQTLSSIQINVTLSVPYVRTRDPMKYLVLREFNIAKTRVLKHLQSANSLATSTVVLNKFVETKIVSRFKIYSFAIKT